MPVSFQTITCLVIAILHELLKMSYSAKANDIKCLRCIDNYRWNVARFELWCPTFWTAYYVQSLNLSWAWRRVDTMSLFSRKTVDAIMILSISVKKFGWAMYWLLASWKLQRIKLISYREIYMYVKLVNFTIIITFEQPHALGNVFKMFYCIKIVSIYTCSNLS